MCRVRLRRLRWPRGKNLAGLRGEFLQPPLQPLPPPFPAFHQHFPFDVGERRQGLQVLDLFLLLHSFYLRFLPVRNRFAANSKNSVKMHPSA